MRVALLLALVGCYSPAYRDCEVTCSGGACPSGYVCDRGVCRVEGFSGLCGMTVSDSGVDAVPNGDEDSDTILNKDDNCVSVANTNQANEDGDPRGDACDPCPVDAMPGADDDADMDGVGNGCDPAPDMRNRIRIFEGFANGAPTGAATMPPAAWIFQGGTATATPNGGLAMLTWPESPSAFEMVSAHFTINDLAATVAELEAGVIQQYTSSGVVCYVGQSGRGEGLYAGMMQPGSPNAANPFTPQPFSVGQTAITGSTRVNDVFTCNDFVTKMQVASQSPLIAGSARTGFFSYGVNVTLDWIIFIDRVP